jgi:hypothetical protein
MKNSDTETKNKALTFLMELSEKNKKKLMENIEKESSPKLDYGQMTSTSKKQDQLERDAYKAQANQEQQRSAKIKEE